MGADKSDLYHATRVIDPHNQTVLVAGQIEHHPLVLEGAGIAEGRLDIGGTRPVGTACGSIPGKARFSSAPVGGCTVPECFRGRKGNDPHGRCSIVPNRDLSERMRTDASPSALGAGDAIRSFLLAWPDARVETGLVTGVASAEPSYTALQACRDSAGGRSLRARCVQH